VVGQNNGVLYQRHVPGPGVDETVVSYAGSDTASRQWLLADERGSPIAVANASGTATTIDTYDEYGVPGGGNVGRFQYAGQIWIAEIGLYHDKARDYSPTLGRFLQPDPIGYGGGMNLYGYAGGDPIDNINPSGMGLFSFFRSFFSGAANGFDDFFSGGGGGHYRFPYELTVFAERRYRPFYSPRIPQNYGLGPGRVGGGKSAGTPNVGPNLLDQLKKLACGAPTAAAGGGLDAYAGAGGSVSGAASFNPKNGQISIGFDAGAGVGIGGGAHVEAGKFVGLGNPTADALPLIGVDLNVNVSGHTHVNIPALYNLGC
jgi:RHS repeat-associated protein